MTPEHASLGRAHISDALAKGDLDEALRIAEANVALGSQLADQDVGAVALQDRARVLLSLGRVDEGMSDLNEAMVAAIGRNLALSVSRHLLQCHHRV
jgi:cobalamin-dependent methionine synthase I